NRKADKEESKEQSHGRDASVVQLLRKETHENKQNPQATGKEAKLAVPCFRGELPARRSHIPGPAPAVPVLAAATAAIRIPTSDGGRRVARDLLVSRHAAHTRAGLAPQYRATVARGNCHPGLVLAPPLHPMFVMR